MQNERRSRRILASILDVNIYRRSLVKFSNLYTKSRFFQNSTDKVVDLEWLLKICQCNEFSDIMAEFWSRQCKEIFWFFSSKTSLTFLYNSLEDCGFTLWNLHFFEMLSTFFTQCDGGCLCEAIVDFSFTLQTPCDKDRINTLNFGRNLFESYTSRSFTFSKVKQSK